MKITMYELLGMVKDGKAPKKIRYNNDVYVYIEKYGDYRCEKTSLYLLDKIIRDNDYNIGLTLEIEVEILEEIPKISKLYINNKLQYNLEEKKIPEKIYYGANENGELSINGFTFDYEQKIQIIDTLNGVIDYLKNKGDE